MLIDGNTTAEELSQVLIGSTHVVNSIFDHNETALYSIDNLRFGLKIPKNKFDKFRDLNDTWTQPEYTSTIMNNQKLVGFRDAWVHGFKESSINIAVGWNAPSGKVDWTMGYIDFNPNKVGEQGKLLLERMSRANVITSVKRYDLAIDVPIQREQVRLKPDNRVYKYIGGRSMTEYLGQRSKPGFVKVYDKQVESELEFPLTRIELTCAGEWDTEGVSSKLPDCYSLGNKDFDGLQRSTKIVALMSRYIEANGGIVDPWLRMMNPHTRAKIKKALSQEVVINYSPECISGIIDQVREWETF